MENKLPQNIQNIILSHKLYGENHENLESGIDCRRNKRTIRNCHDATLPHTQKMHSRIQTFWSQENINHLMYMDDIKLFAKNEKELETLMHAVRIYSQDIGMEFSMDKYIMLVMKRDTRHPTDWMELTNQDKIRTVGEKETCKYLGLLEAYTIKHLEMKENV